MAKPFGLLGPAAMTPAQKPLENPVGLLGQIHNRGLLGPLLQSFQDVMPSEMIGRAQAAPGQMTYAAPSLEQIGQGAHQAALMTPGLGDIYGPIADAQMLWNDPESRTPGNIGMAALGALPLLPSLAGITKGVAREPSEIGVRVRPITREFADVTGQRTHRATVGHRVKVLVNPDDATLRRHAPEHGYRTMADYDGNIYAWDAEEALHMQVDPVLRAQIPNFSAPEAGWGSEIVLDADEFYEYWDDIAPEVLEMAEEYGDDVPQWVVDRMGDK